MLKRASRSINEVTHSYINSWSTVSRADIHSFTMAQVTMKWFTITALLCIVASVTGAPGRRSGGGGGHIIITSGPQAIPFPVPIPVPIPVHIDHGHHHHPIHEPLHHHFDHHHHIPHPELYHHGGQHLHNYIIQSPIHPEPFAHHGNHHRPLIFPVYTPDINHFNHHSNHQELSDTFYWPTGWTTTITCTLLPPSPCFLI